MGMVDQAFVGSGLGRASGAARKRGGHKRIEGVGIAGLGDLVGGDGDAPVGHRLVARFAMRKRAGIGPADEGIRINVVRLAFVFIEILRPSRWPISPNSLIRRGRNISMKTNAKRTTLIRNSG